MSILRMYGQKKVAMGKSVSVMYRIGNDNDDYLAGRDREVSLPLNPTTIFVLTIVYTPARPSALPP
jgi:hypothetical protein